MVYFFNDEYGYPMEKSGVLTPVVQRTKRGAPVPYYMAFPLNDGRETEEENERDFEYMKQMYPEKIKRVMAVIEEECDKLEYEGSMMFDEYPDKFMLSQLCSKICDQVHDVRIEEVYEAMQRRPDRDDERPPHHNRDNHHNRDDWFSDIVQTLLFDEMHRRRCRHRGCRRRWERW